MTRICSGPKKECSGPGRRQSSFLLNQAPNPNPEKPRRNRTRGRCDPVVARNRRNFNIFSPVPKISPEIRRRGHAPPGRGLPGDGPCWQQGDLFVSMRHISTVMLYRPSTNRVLWLREGPWSSQHDVDIVDDHTIAAFNNNVFDKGSGARIAGSNNIISMTSPPTTPEPCSAPCSRPKRSRRCRKACSRFCPTAA
ncbi:MULTISPECIES: arylsulfotransferase family protein [Actibacterium]|uniref:arylsulfotransferase family protein n=1 Tax=Actibacterium TaxID=1433986 RepID=UPI00351151B1